jgi:hypothetical protein
VYVSVPNGSTVKAPFANADVVRIAGVDTLKASKMLIAWREQGLLISLPADRRRAVRPTWPITPRPGGKTFPLLAPL